MDAPFMPGNAPHDLWAIDGKFGAPEEHAELLVIGAGPAGLAAATHAARLGHAVVLIDENPVSASLMALDVPQFYGQRMNAAVQAESRMVERIVAATPAIEAAFDAGVDVRLGVTAWGVFANGPAVQSLPARIAALSDGKRSWLCSFDALIMATGARDLVLGFAGVDLPGVMGARALHSLLTRYDAFGGQRLVILGSGDLAATTALAAMDRGIQVTALIEVLPETQASSRLTGALAARGTAVRTNTTILRVEGDITGVRAAIVAAVGSDSSERVECDTICLAIGTVPAIELAGVLGCQLIFRGDLGGHVPFTDAYGASSIAGVFCVGDCAGIVPDADAETQGRITSGAASAWLRKRMPEMPESSAGLGPDTTAYRLSWARALLGSGDLQAPVCLCEEVTRGELLGIRPPRYLGCASDKIASRDCRTLMRDGPLNPDQIKRLTRAGMGHCQGRRCREQIALLLAVHSATSLADIPLASYRAPVRPLPLGILADKAETLAMQQQWDVWFGIRTQWVPYDIIGTPEEDAFLAAGAGGNMHA